MSKNLIRLLILGLASATVATCGDDPSSTAPSRVHRPLTEQLDTADITFYFAEGDSVNAEYQQAFHDWAVPYLGVILPQRLRYYKYFGNDHMRALTGQPYGSWADIERYSIHSVERQQGHEAIHVYTFVIGWPSDYFTEGIAVALDLNPFTGEEVPFFGAPVHTLCRNWLEEGNLYRIEDIVASDAFLSGQWTSTYPQSGSFVQFMIAEFGVGPLKSLFRAVGEYDSTETILSTFESIYGLPLEEAEHLWHEFLRGS
jgi:hypothetical protein